MLAIAPPGGTVVLENETAAHVALGKPVTASAIRVLAFDTRAMASAARQDAIDTALASGWRMNLERDPVAGAKVLTTGPATLTIASYRESGTHRVLIYLEHRRCPRQTCGGE